MARVSLIERARARTRREASTGAPLIPAQRQIVGNPAMHFHHRPAGGQMASPVIRQYTYGYRPSMVTPPGVPSPYPTQSRHLDMTTNRPASLGQRTAWSTEGTWMAPGSAVEFAMVTGPGATRRRAMRRMASVGGRGCGCKDY